MKSIALAVSLLSAPAALLTMSISSIAIADRPGATLHRRGLRSSGLRLAGRYCRR